MPLYEEKLICPFAVRFSQERIKEVFQDGREVADALGQIEARSASGEYDLVLQAPFPAIEILRWCPRHSVATDGEHWFTLDNRRLYCLQKAAAAHWPKRVAAVVQVLYNDAGCMWRKYDSTTCGRSVSIGRCLEAIVAKWDWSAEVAAAGEAGADRSSALAAVAADDGRVSRDDLADEEPDSLTAMLRRFAQADEASAPTAAPPAQKQPATAKPKSATAGCRTPSTNDGSEDSESSSEHEAAAAKRAATVLSEQLCGVWEDARGEGYVVQARAEGAWCARMPSAGGKKFTISYSQEDGLVWWGSAKSHFLDPADVVKGAERVQWYAARDRAKRRPRFVWHRSESEPSAGASCGKGGSGSREEAGGGGEEGRSAGGAKSARGRRPRHRKAQDRADLPQD